MTKFYWLFKLFSFSSLCVTTLRYIIYRKAVIEPSDLILLHKSETSFYKATNKNLPISIKVNNSVKKIGFLGQLSQSMILNKQFWDYPTPEKTELYLYELTAEGYATNPKLKKLNHSLFEGFYHKSWYNRIYKDTFDYKLLASKINSDELDILIITIETLGRFTYGELINLIITDTKIVTINPGNFPYFHPKIYAQGQIQLPPCWKVYNKQLIHTSNYVIDGNIYLDRFFLYDRRELKIERNLNGTFKNIIFVHSRLSKVNSDKFLKIIEKLLNDDPKRMFYLIGVNDQNALNPILNFFKKTKVNKQFKYLGEYRMNFNENGEIKNKNWELTKHYLKTSAVFLNPFPKGSGSSRMEAFISGLPVIDLEIDFMNPSEKNKKEYVLAPLIKNNGTAYSENEYYDLATKAIINKTYRKLIIEEQYKIAEEFFYESYFWEKIESI